MKKSKITGDISVMEVSKATAPSPGVRTRAAKTLALKRLNSSAADSALPNDSSCYLQLRSRRLEKPSSLIEPKQPPRVHRSGIKESGSRSRVDSVNSVPVAQSSNEDECFDNFVSVQVSCGENSLGFESRHRFVVFFFFFLCPNVFLLPIRLLCSVLSNNLSFESYIVLNLS